MSVIYYARLKKGAAERLKKVIEAVVPAERMEAYRTIESLAHRLRQPTDELVIIVLVAASRRDLTDILSIDDLLRGYRKIIILPDREEDTIAKGHRVRPRFLTYIDSDFAEVAAVLRKMLEGAS